ncbi:MAG: SLC13 family permease [Spirochaetes bacterium]|nr:SLC13 family permease [Spirochaetota bacterium]
MNTTMITVAVTIVAYILISLFSDRKLFFSLGAAVLLILLGSTNLRAAIFEDVNWNVLAIYVGSLILAELFIYSKVPAVIAEIIAGAAPSTGMAIALICLFTGFVSAFVENVATVLVVAPIAIELSKKMKVPVGSVLVLLAVNANLQGTATLVGDPPSMLFAGAVGFGFNDFFFYDGRISIFFFVQFGALVAFLFCWFYLKRFSKKEHVARESRVVSWVPLLLLLVMVVGLAVNSLSEAGVGMRAGFICLGCALLGQLWFIIFRKERVSEAIRIIRELDWETMFFLAGIFVMLGALNRSGAVEAAARLVSSALGSNMPGIFVVVVAVSVIISGFVDNVPYIALMLPLIGQLGRDGGYDPMVIYFGLLVGACLGGNVTPFGASANIVAVGMAKKHGDPVSFGRFVKIGAPFTLLTTVATATVLWLVWKP